METNTQTSSALHVYAIDSRRLAPVYDTANDGHGNRLEAITADGQGEPLRCCLRNARQGEQIAVISYAPFDHPSVWTEVGPVFIHATPCTGYTGAGRLPEDLSTGPCVLRTYRDDDTMNYDHNTVITDRTELRPLIERLLDEPDVATVHVRSLRPQCFLYAVSRPRIPATAEIGT